MNWEDHVISNNSTINLDQCCGGGGTGAADGLSVFLRPGSFGRPP